MRKRHRHTGTCRPEGPPSGAKLLTNDKWGPKRWQPAAFCTPPASRLQAMLCLSPPSRRRRINYAWEARRWELRGIWWVINGGLMHIHCRKHKEILGEGGKKIFPRRTKTPWLTAFWLQHCILCGIHDPWAYRIQSVSFDLCHTPVPLAAKLMRELMNCCFCSPHDPSWMRGQVSLALWERTALRGKRKWQAGRVFMKILRKKSDTNYEPFKFCRTNKSIIFQIKPSQVLWLRWIQEQPSIKSVFMYQVFIYEEIMKSNWKWVICLYSKKA